MGCPLNMWMVIEMSGIHDAEGRYWKDCQPVHPIDSCIKQTFFSMINMAGLQINILRAWNNTYDEPG